MVIVNKVYRKLQSLGVRKKIYKYYYETITKTLTNPVFEQLFPLKRKTGDDARKISLAITHYNRSQLIRNSLVNILQDERINDVVIYDDCSSIEEFDKMRSLLQNLSPKISIYRGEENYGPYKSKITAVSKCRNDWAVILDSDNVLSRSYVDTLYQIPQWNPHVLYCPSFAKPDFDFRRLANIEINLEQAKAIIIKNQHIKLFRNFLNDGNYFVNVHNYVSCGNNREDMNVRAADVIVFNYAWLTMGYSLYVVNNLQYYHRIHSGSYQIGTWRNSRKIVDEILHSITNTNN